MTVKNKLHAIFGVLMVFLIAMVVIAADSRLEMVMAVVLLLLAGCGYWVMHRTVLLPLRRLVQDVKTMSAGITEGRGDLTQRLDSTAKDEFGELASSFNAYVESLQRIIQEATRASMQMSTAAEELSVVTNESQRGGQQQQSEIDQVATAMNEMSATVQEVARNAAVAAEAARKANGEASNGQKVVSETVNAINEVAAEVESATAVIHKLNADSNQIGTVLDVIRGIAEQTNLLALNAAIEAARAGEQGRGFAVVADEVRTLATRTQDSTREIQKMIEGLQVGTRNAVQVMEQGRSKAQTSVQQAAGAGESLSSITGVVGTISDMNAQIASAAEQQGAVAEEINRNIVNISQITGQTAAGAGQIASASKELVQLAVRMQGLVGSFKT
jgi:methyl-accepting chemotaxis protein